MPVFDNYNPANQFPFLRSEILTTSEILLEFLSLSFFKHFLNSKRSKLAYHSLLLKRHPEHRH